MDTSGLSCLIGRYTAYRRYVFNGSPSIVIDLYRNFPHPEMETNGILDLSLQAHDLLEKKEIFGTFESGECGNETGQD